MTWQPDIYFSDGSGDVHSKDPRLRRAGWGTVRLDQDGELREACRGSVPGKQTVPRAQLMALVILENIEVAGNYELRVDAQYLLTSMASPEQNVGITGTCGRDSSDHANRSPSANLEEPHGKRAGDRLCDVRMKRALLNTTSIRWCWVMASCITPTKPG